MIKISKFTSHNFYDKSSLGDKAVVKVVQYLEGKGFEVENVEDDRFYQKKDIDLLVAKGNKNFSVEVKGDSYKPNNLYVEVISNVGKGTPGCLLYTESDYVFYCFVNYDLLYIFNTKVFQKWYEINKDDKDKLKKHNSKITTPVGNGNYYESEGRLANIKMLSNDLNAIKKGAFIEINL